MNDFRYDINGLRAVAILGIVFFHLVLALNGDAGIIQGGFIGVDVFFVVSGYVTTMSVIRAIEKDKFTLLGYYIRRAKRVGPALFATVLVFVVLGVLLLGPRRLHDLALEGAYALLFVSNFYYALLTNYFASSLNQTFVHTWFLSMTVQFYIVYPLLLLLLIRVFKMTDLGPTLLVLTVLCFAGSMVYTYYDPKFSYYMLPGRLFAFMAGAVAYFYPLQLSDFNKRNAEFAGLAVIVVCMFTINPGYSWPTPIAAVPVAGTYLCLVANNSNSLLSNVFFQKLGDYSYSAYLVHWPLIVFACRVNLDQYWLGILISIVILTYFVYKLAESRRDIKLPYSIVHFLLIGCCAYIATYGMDWRIHGKISELAQYGGRDILHDGTIRVLNDHYNQDVDFILTGDSFARHYTRDLESRGYVVATVLNDGCYAMEQHITLRPEKIIRPQCEIRYKNFLEAAEQYPDKKIVLAQDWQRYEGQLVDRDNPTERIDKKGYMKAVSHDIQRLAETFEGREVWVVLNPYQIRFDIGTSCMYMNHMTNPVAGVFAKYITCAPTHPVNSLPVNDFIREEVEKYPNLHIIDPNPAVCDGLVCRSMLDNGLPVFQDGLHYSIAGSHDVVQLILEKIGLDDVFIKDQK